MIYLAVLWSYVTDARLWLRNRRLRKVLKRVDWRAFQKRWEHLDDEPSVMGGACSDEYLYRRPGTETAQEWFARTEGKTK